MKIIKAIGWQMKILILLTIRIYQKTLSFDHGPLSRIFPFFGCKYNPSCSEYTYVAVSKYGVIKGLMLGAKRLARCHPFSKGGNDPVP